MYATVEATTDIRRSAKVMQLESMFDVPPAKRSIKTWDVDLPLEDRDWSIGLIVGPSGAGKSRVAKAMFGDALVSPNDQTWAPDKAIVDDFDSMPVKEIVGLLGAVGFNSPPAWLRPYGTLSVGEQFRATCARALADNDGLVVLDEFTSTVDRQVAQVASSTIAKAVRRSNRQLVAVTCHYDVEDWLQPDWVYQPHVNQFTWRSLQRRPPIDLEICKVDAQAWRVFAPHHYLSSELLPAAQCFGAFVDGQIVGFTSYIHFPHARTRNLKRLHRTVVLPDWQGVGIATTLTNWLGERLASQGWRLRSTTAHPAMIHLRMASPRWRLVTAPSARRAVGNSHTSKAWNHNNVTDPRRLVTHTFEYTPPRRAVA